MTTNKQRNTVTRLLMVVGALAILIVPALNTSAPTAAAGSVRLTLSPASQSVTTGSNVVVTIVANTGGASINTVQSVLSYSASQFSFVGVTPGSAFSSFPSPLETSGSVEFSAASTSPITTNQTVATITLKANSPGSSSISLAGVCPAGSFALTCSASYDSVTSANDLGSVAGATYTVANAVTPSGGGSTSSGGSSGSSSAPSTGATGSTNTITHDTSSGTPAASSSDSSSSAPAPDSSSSAAPATSNPAPNISNVQVTNTSTNDATITWQTDIPATSVVNYGLNVNYGLTDQSTDLTTDHSVTLNAANLSPATTYYFEAASASSTGASSTGGTQQFTTEGFSVTIRIVDKDGKPIAGVKVTLDGKTATSNADGAVSFQNVPAGKQIVAVHSGRAKIHRSLTVGTYNAKTGTYQQQKFSLTAARGSNLAWLYVLIGIIIVAGALIVLVGPARIASLVQRLTSLRKPPTDGPSAATGGTAGPTPSNPVITPGSSPSTVTPVLPVIHAPGEDKPASPSALHTTGGQQSSAADATMATSLERLHAPHGPDPGTIFRPSATK